jgi:hypothetical protein
MMRELVELVKTVDNRQFLIVEITQYSRCSLRILVAVVNNIAPR